MVLVSKKSFRVGGPVGVKWICKVNGDQMVMFV